MSSLDKWVGWLERHVPKGVRGLGNRQLFMLRIIRMNGGKYRPRNKQETNLCERLRDKSCLVKNRDQYSITNLGAATFASLRGEEYYEQRNL